jgi:ubiquitin-conjugating enzyme E2 Q
VVDILISTTYTAAGEGVLNPLPVGIGLRVPLPSIGYAPPTTPLYYGQAAPAAASAPVVPDPPVGQDSLVDFDQLSPSKV